ncbi:hypothetical protein B8V81_1505 [Paenibacillus pasadenensis]|uniref:Uncharacterized protein n=1 Tax=Paenibacillus pasadenensis TaxID=217090 RepID=A0A2N5NA90_9BACL|nr:hypothetical protein B8V81_1505 [Paenibacillus pasadenensis]
MTEGAVADQACGGGWRNPFQPNAGLPRGGSGVLLTKEGKTRKNAKIFPKNEG